MGEAQRGGVETWRDDVGGDESSLELTNEFDNYLITVRDEGGSAGYCPPPEHAHSIAEALVGHDGAVFTAPQLEALARAIVRWGLTVADLHPDDGPYHPAAMVHDDAKAKLEAALGMALPEHGDE